LDWQKATITTASENIDYITTLLTDMGVQGVEIVDAKEMADYFAQTSQSWDYIDDALLPDKDSAHDSTAKVIFYLGTNGDSNAFLNKIKSALAPEHQLTVETVNDQTWLHEWKKYFHPIRIGRVLVVPEWEADKPHDSEIVFIIDPGSAFGTGQHATTILCIKALHRLVSSKSKVLDIGSGSGILSIISRQLGAPQVVGCDIDPAAVEVALKNAQLNNVTDGLHMYSGNILSDAALLNKIDSGYDIVIANIVADVIIAIAPMLKGLLNPGGQFIASGIIDQRLQDVLDALAANNLKHVNTESHEGWCCVVANG